MLWWWHPQDAGSHTVLDIFRTGYILVLLVFSMVCEVTKAVYSKHTC